VSGKNSYSNISENFISKIAEISAGYIAPAQFEVFIQSIEKEAGNRLFDSEAESNFLRILNSRFDKFSFLNDCIKYPVHSEILVAVSCTSNYLTDILVRNPEFFFLVSNPSTLEERLKEEKFGNAVNSSLASYKSFGTKVNYFKTTKRREILRIGVRDILGISTLTETTEQLSILARIISKELFKLCYNETLIKLGITEIENNYCLIALGKLGGNELNYSSDIDFIIFYEHELKTQNFDYHEILIKTIYSFIEKASLITSEGYIYRVDFRLRPDGRNSPLCGSVSTYIDYYESRGEDWERQMLIKADLVAGSRELYDRFINYLTHFIYPSSFSSSPLDQIKKLKDNIEKNLGSAENIKLSSGGIRDIEFSVQALQLLNGGKIPELRISNTQKAIEQLTKNNLLKENEAGVLFENYIFYRKIEHFLQLMNDRQTHSIPKDGPMLDRLSNFMGFDNSENFSKELNEKREKVRSIFNSVTHHEEDDSQTLNEAKINFANPSKAQKNLDFLQTGKGLLGQKHFDQKSIEEFHKIENDFIEYLKRSKSPDKILDNFVRFIKFDSFLSIWYREFKDKEFFHAFLSLCEFSQKTINLFAEDKELRELFLSRHVFEKQDKNKTSEFSTKKITFGLGTQFSLGLIPLIELSRTLSDFFTQKIKKLASIYLENKLTEQEYFIAAMGSFGSLEMTMSSDIDLIFVVKKHVDMSHIQTLFQSFLTELKTNFAPFEVDCRLRPEGKSSQLVWEIESYKNYINSRARTWEIQAFSKLRFVSGSNKIFNELVNSVLKKVESLENNLINTELFEMRKKMYPREFSLIAKVFNVKNSRGGLSDIEFIIQKQLLEHGELYKKLMGMSTLEKINILTETGELPESEELRENFLFLKNLELQNQLIFDNKNPLIYKNGKNNPSLASKMNFEKSEDFEIYLDNIIKSNSQLFLKYFK